MSFLDSIIQEEVSKKRKVLEAVSSKEGADKKLKYVSRAELERIRQEEYKHKEQERREKEKQVKRKKHESIKDHGVPTCSMIEKDSFRRRRGTIQSRSRLDLELIY
jgi:pre-mRNA-splicing factor 18